MENSPDCILHMFIRPGEPLFMPKGKKKVVFCVPEDYTPKRYLSIAKDIAKHFERDDNHKIHIDAIDVENLDFTLQLGRDDQFSVFIPAHVKMAGVLIGIFMAKKTNKEFLSAAAYCRDRINPHLFIYALSVAILHRPDTKNLTLPALSGVFPHLFINSVTLKKAKEEVNSVPEHCRSCITIERDHTATNLDIEHRVAYFREDLGVNLHHYHWHLIYPNEVGNKCKEIVAKDRRGELFYYMHQQIIARYNCERLSNNLVRVKSLNCWRQPISEGYFSKLGADSSTTFYPGRHSGATLKDVDRPDGRFEIQDLERLRDRIVEAIHRRSIIDATGKSMELDEITGIDTLGNIIEASSLSPNPTLYGNLHNQGHVAIATCHDPDNRHLEKIGVMGNNTTAMRDPVFYRWHAFIDDIFQAHKDLLQPYTNEKLEYKEVKITNVEILSRDDKPTSTLYTHWQQSDVEISGGLDYQSGGSISVRFTHLNHKPFSYVIDIENKNEEDKMGTVRIFMAPKRDERGYNFALDKQRKLMIELDKFTVTLKPGIHTIIRRSDESSVTIPFELTFPKLDESNSTSDITPEQANWCGCGWPQHMLIPRGRKEGFLVDLFVMVSDYSDDKVDQGPTTCKNAASFCGLKDKKYPDARAMGYPFDRPLKTNVKSFDQFMTANMHRKEMKIIFSDEIKEINRKSDFE